MNELSKIEALVEEFAPLKNFGFTLSEAFNGETYPLDEKIMKSPTDIQYIFSDEEGQKYRLQVMTSPKFGKGVAKIYVGKNVSGRTYKDKIDKFTNAPKMIATILKLFDDHLRTPEGMKLNGFIIDLSGAAAVRAVPLMKKVINSTLRSKVKIAADFDPVQGRRYIWAYKSTLTAGQVFNGVGSEGAPWWEKGEKKEDSAVEQKSKKDKQITQNNTTTQLKDVIEIANAITDEINSSQDFSSVKIGSNVSSKKVPVNSEHNKFAINFIIAGVTVHSVDVEFTATDAHAWFKDSEIKKITKDAVKASQPFLLKIKERKNTEFLETRKKLYDEAIPGIEEYLNKLYPDHNISVKYDRRFNDPKDDMYTATITVDGKEFANTVIFISYPASSNGSAAQLSLEKAGIRNIPKIKNDATGEGKIKSDIQKTNGNSGKTLSSSAIIAFFLNSNSLDVSKKITESLLSSGFKNIHFGTSNGSSKVLESTTKAGSIFRVSSSLTCTISSFDKKINLGPYDVDFRNTFKDFYEGSAWFDYIDPAYILPEYLKKVANKYGVEFVSISVLNDIDWMFRMKFKVDNREAILNFGGQSDLELYFDFTGSKAWTSRSFFGSGNPADDIPHFFRDTLPELLVSAYEQAGITPGT